jgi:hypothetical protein
LLVGLAVVVVLAATVLVEVVLVELLPQPATATAAATAVRRRVRRITARLTTPPVESFGDRCAGHLGRLECCLQACASGHLLDVRALRSLLATVLTGD